MRFGVCFHVNDAAEMAAMGYDYLEVHAGNVAAMSEEEFEAFCAENAAAPIHAETANCLFPGTIRLTGEEADMEVVKDYAEKVMSRLSKAGIKIVVFGSGGSRRIPEGFSREQAWQQLIEVGKILGAAAEKYGVTVALEPLRSEESNVITKQAEGLKLVQDVDHPHFKILCDYYHLMQEGGTMEDVEACAGQLVHIHIAEPKTRVAMRPDDGTDYAAFFASLRKIGYDGRISFEGLAGDREKTLPIALKVLKNA